MAEIKNNKPITQGYYNGRGKKIADFFIGLLGVAITYFIGLYASALVLPIKWLNFFPTLLVFLFWPALIAVIVLAARAKRKFIIWGIAIAYLIPFLFVALLWGMCAFGAIKW